MKICTVVGARPQFVKAATVSRALRRNNTEILIHTGQHYDKNMSDVFFEDLSIPKPDFNLGVGSGSHAKQTAAMLIGIEDILVQEKPDVLLTYGDTNSTLASAVAAAKLHIPIAHVEAGLRSFNMHMPEEQNRIVTDRLSKFLFCPTDTAVLNLGKEGLYQHVYNVGDVMCDAVTFYSRKVQDWKAREVFSKLEYIYKNQCPMAWYLATIHRAENTDHIAKLEQIFEGLEQLDEQVIFPLHPRIKKMTDALHKAHSYQNILFIEPLGYLEMLFFTKNAKAVITDSGGLQKEAYMLDVFCVTVRDQTEWIETVESGRNVLCKPLATDIIQKVSLRRTDKKEITPFYGDGKAAEKIIQIMEKG